MTQIYIHTDNIIIETAVCRLLERNFEPPLGIVGEPALVIDEYLQLNLVRGE